MLLDLIAAHRVTAPDALETLGSAPVMTPELARALLTNPRSSALTIDRTLASIARTIQMELPSRYVADGATWDQALGPLSALSPGQWQWLLPVAPTLPPDVGRLVSSAAVRARNRALAVALVRDERLDPDARLDALLTASLMGTVDESLLEAVAYLAGVRPERTSALQLRSNAHTSTLLNAARKPYPATESATQILERTLAGAQQNQRSPDVTQMQLHCALLRAGTRASAVAAGLLPRAAGHPVWLSAIALAVSVERTLRVRAALLLARTPDAVTEPVAAALDDLIADPAVPPAAVSAYLERVSAQRACDPRSVLRREDLSAEQLETLWSRTGVVKESNIATDIVCRPAATGALRAAVTRTSLSSDLPLITELADRASAGDRTAWTHLPLRYTHAAANVGLTHAINSALTHLLADLSGDGAQALLMLPLDELTGTLNEPFSIARAISS